MSTEEVTTQLDYKTSAVLKITRQVLAIVQSGL